LFIFYQVKIVKKIANCFFYHNIQNRLLFFEHFSKNIFLFSHTEWDVLRKENGFVPAAQKRGSEPTGSLPLFTVVFNAATQNEETSFYLL